MFRFILKTVCVTILILIGVLFVFNNSFYQFRLMKTYTPNDYESRIKGLFLYPALASITAVNLGWNITDSSVSSHIELAKLIEIYQQNLDEKMKFDLKMKDLIVNDTLNSWLNREKNCFLSNSTYNSKYTLQTFNNVCIDTKLNKLIFIVNSTTNKSNYLDQFNISYDLSFIHNRKEYFHWLPIRYKTQLNIDSITNQEFQHRAHDWFYIDDITMHQLSWMWNIGHQFHEQIWTVFMQLYFHQHFGTNKAKLLFLDFGCKTFEYPSLKAPLSVMPGAWHLMNQFFLHLIASQTDIETILLRIPNAQCRSSVVCFKELIVGSSQDDRYDKSDFGIEGLRQIRRLVRTYLQLDSMPINAKHSKPVRITIISRLDSQRRRLLNGDELINRLKSFIEQGLVSVNHLKQFGSRPYYEQLAAMAFTDILIAPHGAHMTFSFMLPDNSFIFECYPDSQRRDNWIYYVVKAMNITRIELVGQPDPINMQRRISDIEKFPKADRNRGSEILQIFDMDFRLNITEVCIALNQLTFGIICL